MYERRLGIFTGTVPTQMRQSLLLELYHRSVRRSVALCCNARPFLVCIAVYVCPKQ